MKANFESIYEHVGYLFYALASEDKKLSFTDFDTLKSVIAQNWKPAINSETGLQCHLVDCIYNSLWVGFHNHMDSNTAFELFDNFYLVHELNFANSFRDKIFVTANAIVHEFTVFTHKTQKSELLKEVVQLLRHEPALS
jgi:hypothetical protein